MPEGNFCKKYWNEMAEKNAVFIQIVPDCRCSEDYKKKWKVVCGLGFLVTERGCWIPRNTNWGSNMDFLEVFGCQFKRRNLDPGSRDEQGRPNVDQHSHLCHNPFCCNPAHIVIEPQWMNQKRNYCRGNIITDAIEMNSKKSIKVEIHDCLMLPKCLFSYVSSHKSTKSWQSFNSIGYDEATKKLTDNTFFFQEMEIVLKSMNIESLTHTQSEANEVENCHFCGKEYARVKGHESFCKENPGRKKKSKRELREKHKECAVGNGMKKCLNCGKIMKARGLGNHSSYCFTTTI